LSCSVVANSTSSARSCFPFSSSSSCSTCNCSAVSKTTRQSSVFWGRPCYPSSIRSMRFSNRATHPQHGLVRGVNLNQGFHMLGVDCFTLFFQGRTNLGLVRDKSGSNKGFFFFELTLTCVGLIEFGVDTLQVVLFGRNVFQKFLQMRSGFGAQLGGLGLFTKSGKSEVTKRIKRPPRRIILVLVLTHTTPEITNSSLGKTYACMYWDNDPPFWVCSNFAIHY
jgi:hypothetical protein